jgi:hypothetical protein
MQSGESETVVDGTSGTIRAAKRRRGGSSIDSDSDDEVVLVENVEEEDKEGDCEDSGSREGRKRARSQQQPPPQQQHQDGKIVRVEAATGASSLNSAPGVNNEEIVARADLESWPGEALFEEAGIFFLPVPDEATARLPRRALEDLGTDFGPSPTTVAGLPRMYTAATVTPCPAVWRGREKAVGVSVGSGADVHPSMWVEPVKVVIFSQFTSMLDLVEDALVRNGIAESRKRTATGPSLFVRLDGTTSLPNRARAVECFRKEPNVWIFLISLKAGGLGLNLTEGCVVYLLDPWYAAAPEDQAINRVHRLGQLRSVTVRRFITAGTVEETVLALQERKRKLAEAALASGTATVRGMDAITLEDLQLFFRATDPATVARIATVPTK